MIIKKRFLNTFAAIGILAMLMMPLTGCGAGKNIASGSSWEVTETTNLDKLTIAEGADIKAPEGKNVTMTVNGVETPIAAGTYNGKITLTVTDDILVDKNNKTYRLRTAVYVSDGKYMPEKSVAASVLGGTVTDTSASDVNITSVGDNFNGIIVTGDNKSSYSIVNPVINMTGNGRNDFAGFGAAIKTDGKAEVTIENARINTTGAVRPAIWIGGDSVTTINNAEIETHSGKLPSDYSFSWIKGSMQAGDNFMEVPWMLGCVGNTRSTIVMDNGQAYYNNSHIKAYGWGALSTDQVSSDSILIATNCIIETAESGYGAFSDGNANTYSGCTFNVADYALIMQRGSAHFTDGTVVNSERLGAMSYSNATTLIIDKGTVFNTKKAAIQIKGGSPTIVVDDAKLNSENGVIFQAMLHDDPFMVAGGDPSAFGSAPGGDPGASGGMPGGDMPGAVGGGPKVTFKNVTLNGDIITSMTTEGDVDVHLEKATITGAITTSIAEHAKGPNGEELTLRDETDLYKIIGEVIDTYGATDDKYGMKVSLDGNSIWVVDKSSYLTSLIISEGGTINAPEGATLTMTVNGVKKPIKAGEYKGKIVLAVTKP